MLAVICDDEQKDRELVGGILRQKMKKRGEHLELVYCDCGEDLIRRYEDGFAGCDLIFMDIFMEHLNGIEVMRRVRQYDRKAAVIFVTTSPDYAIESYGVRACGYLLKPVEPPKVEEVVNRFLAERYPRVKKSLLMINGSAGRRIPYDEILYIESSRMNLRIVCAGGTEYSIRKKLDDVQAELPESRFLRCNQSFIVNMDRIKDADTEFTMDNGDRIPIKVRDKKRIRDRYAAYLLELGWDPIQH